MKLAMHVANQQKKHTHRCKITKKRMIYEVSPPGWSGVRKAAMNNTNGISPERGE